jgi:acyl-CoA dehydrogenase
MIPLQVAVVNAALDVVDHAMQVHGGAGISQEFPLAAAWAGLRTLRYADGPGECFINRPIIFPFSF